MGSVETVALAMQTVLKTVANRAAKRTGFQQRQSKLTGSAFVRGLVFGWLSKPQATLEELAQAIAAGGVTISTQGLDQRFTPQAAALLKDVLEAATGAVVATSPGATEILDRFTAVYVADSTVIALPNALRAVWPGCGGSHGPSAGLKVQVCMDYKAGGLQLSLHPAKEHDRTAPIQTMPLQAGSLRITDLGFFKLAALADCGARSAFWLTRLQANVQVFEPGVDKPRDLAELIEAHGGGRVDIPIEIGTSQHLPCRLIAVRVPQEVADTRRRKLHEEARRRGQTISPTRLRWADWTILVTNIPADQLTVAEALVLGRIRWQIELLFKLWKSGGLLARWRTHRPQRILCEVYAKLLAMIVQHWVLLVSCWEFSDRSLPKAAQCVQKFALALTANMTRRARLVEIITAIRNSLANHARVKPRKHAPAAFQLLADPIRHGLA